MSFPMRGRRTILMAVVAVAAFGRVSPTASAAIIGVDAVNGFNADAVMATGNEFDSFRSVITGLGHTLVPLNSFDAAALSGLDAAIFVTPYQAQYGQNSRPYAAGEIAAIHAFANQRAVFLSDTGIWMDDIRPFGSEKPITFGSNQKLLENVLAFVSQGHGAVFLGENGSGFNVANMNTLVASYGISYSDTPIDFAPGRAVSGFVPHAVTAGLNEIGVQFQLPMTVNSPALDLTIGNGGDNVLAVYEVPEPASAILLFGAALSALLIRQKF
jgi:hypothetical protein